MHQRRNIVPTRLTGFFPNPAQTYLILLDTFPPLRGGVAQKVVSRVKEFCFVAERWMNLARPFKAGLNSNRRYAAKAKP